MAQVVTLFLLVGLGTLGTAATMGQKPIVGQYEPYNSQRGVTPPFPGTLKGPILPKKKGRPAPDDTLFQNLATAEWYVSNFYTEAVRSFNESSFTALGFPNTTYDRIQEIRNNEVGHLQIIFDGISDTSVKPGPCKYNIKFASPIDFLVRQIALEQGGTAFLPGLIASAGTREHQATLTSLTEVEVRHGSWALQDIWRTNPFSGPVDTVFPYPLQILAGISASIIPGSCPKENPPFPSPPMKTVPMQYEPQHSQGKPGQEVKFTFPAPQLQPKFQHGKKYHAVFFHALSNITVPFDVKAKTARVPSQFDEGKGIIVAVIADQPGAPTEESVVAGPVLLIQQPDLSTLAGKM